MWIFLKKQGTLFDPDRDDFFIQSHDGSNFVFGHIGGESDVLAEFDDDTLHIFVKQFADHLKFKAHMFVFDEDNLIENDMRDFVKGRTSESSPSLGMEVGLE